jgi:cyclohexanone monooxygenase
VIGQNDQSLSDYWAGGMKTLHGFSAHGFPNCYLMGLSQNGFSVNLTSMLDDQAQHIAYIINETSKRGRYSQPTTEGEAAWVATIRALAVMNTAFFEECTPGYYNNEGQLASRGGGLNGEAYAPGANAFNALLAQWRATGDLEGLEIG